MFRKLFASIGLLLVFTVNAQAGPLQDLMSFDGQEDILSDDSASVIRDTDASGTVNVGDVLQGIFEIRTIDGTQTSSVGGTVVGVFSLQVTSMVNVAGITYVDLGLVSGGNVGTWDLGTMLGGFDTSGLSGLASSSIAILDRADGNFSIDQGVGNSLGLDGTTGDLGLVGADWTVEILGGFDGIDDFYQVAFLNPLAAPLPIVPTVGLGGFLGTYATAFSVIDHQLGGGIIFNDVTENDILTGASHVGDIATNGGNGLYLPSSNTPVGFSVRDDGDFVVNAVPEPGTMAIWAGLFGVMAVAGLRRRKSA